MENIISIFVAVAETCTILSTKLTIEIIKEVIYNILFKINVIRFKRSCEISM